MKKTQIFIGASAFILAIAGAFASKASNKFVQVPGFTSDGFGACHHSQLVTCATNGGAPCRTNSGIGKTLFTAVNEGAACGKTLRTIAK